MTDTRLCTCHPDDNPPVPCAHKYAFDECVAAAKKQEKQMTEPKVVRRNPRFGGALPQSQWVQKYSRTDPNWYVPFADDKDYIRATRLDKWVALALGVAVLIVVGLDIAYVNGWLR